MQLLGQIVRVLFIVLVGTTPFLSSKTSAFQLSPTIRDQVSAAAVLIAVPLIWTVDGVESRVPLPIGSGTIVSPDGLVLTNYHVVDETSLDEQIMRMQTEITKNRPTESLRRLGPEFVLLGSDGSTPPSPRYFAMLVAEDQDRDIAVLRITEYADGDRLGNPVSITPFIVFGNSDEANLGDRVQIFAYPAIGGDSLTYTTGVISGFGFDESTGERDWISTDAVVSGGSSGGTAINDEGRLIGIPSAGSELDCRTGDTNRDGIIDEDDVGCIPVGGSLGVLVPVNDAFDLLVRTGLVVLGTNESESAVRPTPTPTAISNPTTSSVAGSVGCAFGFVERFDDPGRFPPLDDVTRSVSVSDDAFHANIKTPGSMVTYAFDECETGGDSASFQVSVRSTNGWGEVIILILTEDGAEWFFCVDPQAQTWSLYRNNLETDQLFYWIQPISFAGIANNQLNSLEIAVTDGEPSFGINGHPVADSQSFTLPDMSGNLIFGFGAGINPDSLSGSGQTFGVAFESIVLAEN